MTNLNENTLYNIIKNFDNISIYDYCKVREFFEFICNNKEKIEIISKNYKDKWKNDNPQYYPLDLFKWDNWCTYDKCLQLEIKPQLNKLKVTIYVHDGDMLDGWRNNIRWTAELLVPKDYLLLIENIIKYNVEQLAEEAYELHLETQRINYKQKFINKIFEINNK